MPTNAPAAPAATVGIDPKTTAANITKGIQDRAAGNKPAGAAPAAKGPEIPDGDEKGKPAVDANAGKTKYVVDGKEVWLTQQQAHAYVQKGLAFEPRISELARLQQETSQFLELLKTDPGKVLFNPKIGLTPEVALQKILGSAKISDEIKQTVGRWYYENEVRLAKMDPKDREIHEKNARIEELESAEKRKQEEAIARENKARVGQALAAVKGQIAEAMKEIGLPNMETPVGVQLAKRVADVMRLSYLARKTCTPKQAAQLVLGQVHEAQRMFYDTLDEDNLVAQLGKENAEKVRKHFLKVMKITEKAEQRAASAPPQKRGERKIVTPDEMHDYLDEIKRTNKV